MRLHRDAESSQLANALSARAFTVGHDVFFGAGADDPQTRAGYRTLVHELVHTTQPPTAGPGDTGARVWEPGLVVSDRSSAAEREASAIASGRLHLAGSTTMLLPATASLELEVLAVIIAGEVPIPIEGDISAGLRLTLRASVLGTLDSDVALAYTAGTISLDTLNVLRLGAKIDAALAAVLQLKLSDHPLCVYTWPLAHWDLAENATEYRLPVSLSYGSSGPTFSVGPLDDFTIPVAAIDATIPTWPVTRDCQLLDNLIMVLCDEGILPTEACHGHDGDPHFPPNPPGPIPIVPPTPPTPPVPVPPVPVPWNGVATSGSRPSSCSAGVTRSS